MAEELVRVPVGCDGDSRPVMWNHSVGGVSIASIARAADALGGRECGRLVRQGALSGSGRCDERCLGRVVWCVCVVSVDLPAVPDGAAG